MAAFVNEHEREFHIGVRADTLWLTKHYLSVQKIQCDGDELDLACQVLGRELSFRVFTFIGHDAQLIAANWR